MKVKTSSKDGLHSLGVKEFQDIKDQVTLVEIPRSAMSEQARSYYGPSPENANEAFKLGDLHIDEQDEVVGFPVRLHHEGLTHQNLYGFEPVPASKCWFRLN